MSSPALGAIFRKESKIWRFICSIRSVVPTVFKRSRINASFEFEGAGPGCAAVRKKGTSRRRETQTPDLMRMGTPFVLATSRRFHIKSLRSSAGAGTRGYNPRPMVPAPPIPMLDLLRSHETLKRKITGAVAEIFATGRFILGPAVESFEKAFARELGVEHAVFVSSGTYALLVALIALGVSPGDEVITSPFTFFASASTVARLCARPVCVDIEPGSFNLDASRLEGAITPRTRAIQPVHLYGQCADMETILEVAKRRKIPVLEDACQAVGAAHQGRAAGSMGLLAAFSFYPTKNLGAAGDAGAVTTNDDALAELVASLRVHGSPHTYHHERVGGNFRGDALQAAVLSVKLPWLPLWNTPRPPTPAPYPALL